MIKIEKDIEKYMRAVEDYLVCPKEQKDKVLSEIRNSIYVYAEENGISDIGEVYDHFGTPEEIASQHLSTVDPKKIKKALSIKRVFAIALTALVVSFIVFLVAMYMDAHKDNNGTIEETIIELEEGIDHAEAVSTVEESLKAEHTEER